MTLPLFVGREGSISAVDEALARDRYIFLATQKDPTVEDPKPDELYRTGTVAMIMRMIKLPDGRQASLLVVDDQESIRHFLERALGGTGTRCGARRTEGGRLPLRRQAPDLVMLDLRLPDTTGLKLLTQFKERVPEIPVIMMTAYAEVETAVAGDEAGGLRLPGEAGQPGAAAAGLQPRRWSRCGSGASCEHHRRVERDALTQNFVRGVSPAIRAVYESWRRWRDSDTTSVLITGESGTGKQIVAGLIHEQSPRRAQAVPGDQLRRDPAGAAGERALRPRAGRLHRRPDARSRACSSWPTAGRLFLDEIGEMAATLQVKLLKVLENMTFRRVGGTRDIRVERADHQRHQPGPGGRGDGRALPRGSLLPPHGGADPHAAAAGAPRGHPAARAALSCSSTATPSASGSATLPPRPRPRLHGPTPGRGTSGSCATSSSGPCCWKTARCWRRATSIWASRADASRTESLLIESCIGSSSEGIVDESGIAFEELLDEGRARTHPAGRRGGGLEPEPGGRDPRTSSATSSATG